jgi:hypothetical protein
LTKARQVDKIPGMDATELMRKSFEDSSFGIPDPRNGDNRQYPTEDFILCAFACFFFQNSSFLQFQRSMESESNRSNMKSLFDVDKIPTNDQIRNIIDQIDPIHFNQVYYDSLKWLKDGNYLSEFDVLDSKYNIIVLDGTNIFTSQKIKCNNCTITNHRNGNIDFSHNILAASLVSPNTNIVIPLPPEFLTNNSTNKKQDCEQKGLFRWFDSHSKIISKILKDRQLILLADDLHSHDPVVECLKYKKYIFILNCKPNSHKKLFEYTNYHSSNSIEYFEYVKGFKEAKLHKIDWLSGLPLCDTTECNAVNLFKLTIYGVKEVKVEIQNPDNMNKKNYKKVFTKELQDQVFTFITNMEINPHNIKEFCAIARARWKIENNNFHTLKHGGYNLKHNYGHGKQYLASTLASLNILAFLFHSIFYLSNDSWRKEFNKVKNRKRFFQKINILLTIIYFPSFNHLLRVIGSSRSPPITIILN